MAAQLMAINAKRETADLLARATAGKFGPQALFAVLLHWHDWAKTHPGRYTATVRAPNHDDVEDSNASTAVLDVVYTALSGYRPDGDVQWTRCACSTHTFMVS